MFGGAVNLSSYADILTVEALTTELRENYVLATTLQNYTLAEVTTALAARVTAWRTPYKPRKERENQ